MGIELLEILKAAWCQGGWECVAISRRSGIDHYSNDNSMNVNYTIWILLFELELVDINIRIV